MMLLQIDVIPQSLYDETYQLLSGPSDPAPWGTGTSPWESGKSND